MDQLDKTGQEETAGARSAPKALVEMREIQIKRRGDKRYYQMTLPKRWIEAAIYVLGTNEISALVEYVGLDLKVTIVKSTTDFRDGPGNV